MRFPVPLFAALLAGTAGAQTNPAVDPRQGPVLSAEPPAPVVSAYDVSVCAQPGSRLVVRGNHFDPRGRRQAALGGNGLHLDLVVASWQDRTLTVTIPRDPRIRPGTRYFIGIEDGGHQRWISNVDRPVLICGDPPARPASVDPVPGNRPPPVDPEPPAAGDRQPPAAPPPAARDDSNPEDDTPANPFAAGPSAASGATPATAPPLLQPGSTTTEPDEVEPGELLAWHADLAAAQAFAQRLSGTGFTVLRRRVLSGLDVVQTAVGLPSGMPVGAARNRLQQLDPDLLVDANHRYVPLAAGDDEAVLSLTGWSPAVATCAGTGSIGIVDTAVATAHPAFAGRDLVVEQVLPAGVPAADDSHGTIVAARIATLLPDTPLKVAAIFRQRDEDTTDTTAEWLLLALDWLLREGVAVVNMSLGGPENRLLAAGVARVVARDVGVVAAVGDGGPQSDAVYPSAWPGVLGVTAVDRNRRAYRRARHGAEVDIAAPGVDLPAMHAGGRSVFVSGTSYAAPFVTAAWLLAGDSGAVLRNVEDLGDAGRDDVFGAGLVRFDGLCVAD